MPRSRFKLAIPFIGKDCPSRASEFAHPDVIISLTVLAYRYEGLRRAEFKVDVIGLLRSNFENEVGPYNKRASSLIYQSWVQQAGGSVKGQSAVPPTPTKGEERSEERSEEKVVVPLFLLKQSNEEQMDRLHALLSKSAATIHWYLEQTIFPTYMQQQKVKVSASGQDLGGSITLTRTLTRTLTLTLALTPTSAGSRSSKNARARGAWPSASNVAASDARARAGSQARHGGRSAEGPAAWLGLGLANRVS